MLQSRVWCAVYNLCSAKIWIKTKYSLKSTKLHVTGSYESDEQRQVTELLSLLDLGIWTMENSVVWNMKYVPIWSCLNLLLLNYCHVYWCIEGIFAEVDGGSAGCDTSVLVGTVYRPPNTDMAKLT